MHDALDWLDGAWSNYVMDLDAERQREAIYGPIGRAAQAVWREITDPGRWRAMLDATLATLHLDQLSGAVAWLAAAAAGILATALLAAGGWLFWLLAGRLRAHWTGNHGRVARRRTQIEFYRRFETLLARQGILRAPGQTQREFAAAAGARLALLGSDPQLGRLPGVIAEAFYRVRFGRQPLDSLQAQAVEHALGELAKFVGGDSSRRLVRSCHDHSTNARSPMLGTCEWVAGRRTSPAMPSRNARPGENRYWRILPPPD